MTHASGGVAVDSRWLKVVVACEGAVGEISHRVRPEGLSMTTVILGDLEFDNVLYDGDADVLYRHVGDPLSRSSSTSRRRAMRCAMTLAATSWA
jgi:hypothetical protein